MQLQNFINGEHHPSHETLPLFEPATGNMYGTLPNSSEEDLERAVQAAKAAAPAWGALEAVERGNCLRRLAQLIEDRSEAFVDAEVRDNGKTKGLAAAVDLPRTLSTLRFFASLSETWGSESHMAQGGAVVQYTHRKPVGIVGCIAPWNFPLYLFSWKFAPALAAGNCVIGKPSELTPATAYLLSQLINEAGFPPGVFNILFGEGKGIGEAIVRHPDIPAITFTGGPVAGRRINELASQRFKKVTLEMGGKNAFVVFEDAQIEQAIGFALKSAFANMGQICFCTSRILVHQNVYTTFRDRFVEAVKSMRVGDPLDPATTTGAIVSEGHRDRILRALEQIKAEGGQILCGGGAPPAPNERCKEGYFIAPTVVEGLTNACSTNQEEIFGPVVTLQSFASEQEAVELINDSPFGLTVSIWSQNVHRCHRIAAAANVGTAWINTWMVRDNRAPFGGQKDSGLGREGGVEAMRFFTDAQNVCLAIQS